MRELGPDTSIPNGLTADVWLRAQELQEKATELARDIGRLFVLHERQQQTSADAFRAHTKTEVRGVPCGDWRFNPPEPFNPGADATVFQDEGEGPE